MTRDIHDYACPLVVCLIVLNVAGVLQYVECSVQCSRPEVEVGAETLFVEYVCSTFTVFYSQLEEVCKAVIDFTDVVTRRILLIQVCHQLCLVALVVE